MFNRQVRKVKQSLKYSVFDGSFWAAMAGLTQGYITPFALVLRATTTQIGLLTSIPNLLMALSQLAAPKLVEKTGSRKSLILPVVFLHAMMWLPILLIPFIMPGNKVWWLILFVTVSSVAGSMAGPAWGSMMADLVPERIRGRYFAGRGRIISLITMVFSFAAGGILQLLKNSGFTGFVLIFSGAILARLGSLYFLSKQYEPPMAISKTNQESIFNVIRGLGSNNLGRFSIFVALVSFVTNMASPFFAVYMLRDLNFSYISYVIITSVGSLTGLFFLTYWGRRADRAGNIRVIQITAVLIPFIPLLWLVSKQVWWLVIAETFSSFAWAGFNLAAVNFIYDAAAPALKTGRIAVFNAMNGVAVCFGAFFGSFLATRLPPLLGFSLLTLFVVSGLLRAIVVIVFLRSFKEVRRVPRVAVFDLLFSRHRLPSDSMGRLHGGYMPRIQKK